MSQEISVYLIPKPDGVLHNVELRTLPDMASMALKYQQFQVVSALKARWEPLCPNTTVGTIGLQFSVISTEQTGAASNALNFSSMGSVTNPISTSMDIPGNRVFLLRGVADQFPCLVYQATGDANVALGRIKVTFSVKWYSPIVSGTGVLVSSGFYVQKSGSTYTEDIEDKCVSIASGVMSLYPGSYSFSMQNGDYSKLLDALKAAGAQYIIDKAVGYDQHPTNNFGVTVLPGTTANIDTSAWGNFLIWGKAILWLGTKIAQMLGKSAMSPVMNVPTVLLQQGESFYAAQIAAARAASTDIVNSSDFDSLALMSQVVSYLLPVPESLTLAKPKSSLKQRPKPKVSNQTPNASSKRRAPKRG
ncbi:hypothetical protein 3 [Hubei tombus-like virus 38]|uniref:hypothetical protein 3 n=1 Tax=Hubei tombus-like virus 38 TaxID=1923286 RepID=UPI00090C91FB|nr:hypothetical protein 3 [Hubei tombus-like virus 38]APG76566.1 hypothetical protein 3 [Hubei tombus-like virus 38]